MVVFPSNFNMFLAYYFLSISFEYGGLVAEGFAMNNLSSLVEASINFEFCYEQDGDYTSMTDLLHGISHVRTLHIYGDCIETLRNYGGLRLPVFHSLTTLELGGKRGLQWELLPNLLKGSPNLRTLGFEELDDCEYYDDDDSEVWYPPEHVPTCLLVTLEKIDMGIFRGQQCELKVVEYFLTNAKVLKIVHIRFDQYQMRLERSGYEYEVFRKLLEMPRGSTSCKVLVS